MTRISRVLESHPEPRANLADATYSSLFLRVWCPVALAAPALVFPLTAPWMTVGCLSAALVWYGVAERCGRAWASTLGRADSPLNVPLVVLAVMALVGLFVSNDVNVTLPKFAGLALGLLTLRAVLLTGTNSSRIRMLGLAYLAFGVLTVLIGVLAGPTWKSWGNYPLYEMGLAIPRLFHIAGARAGVNTNALAGTTLFFIPVAVALTCSRLQPADTQHARRWYLGLEVIERGGYALMAASLVTVLLLCQSRTAWVSSVVSVLVVLSIQFRLVAVASGLMTAAVGLGTWWIGPAKTLAMLQSRFQNAVGNAISDDRILSFAGDDREDIWALAVQAIHDQPWTGVGLGAFRSVVPSMVVGVNGDEIRQVVHAHNIFLQVALDVGLPGLVAYVALFVLVSLMTWRVCHHRMGARLRSLALGLWGALLAIHFFGIADAIALGAKVGLFFWLNVGLIAAIYRVVMSEDRRERSMSESQGV